MKVDVLEPPKIDAKYSGAYHKLPGLAVEYYVASENGLFKYISLNSVPISEFNTFDNLIDYYSQFSVCIPIVFVFRIFVVCILFSDEI